MGYLVYTCDQTLFGTSKNMSETSAPLLQASWVKVVALKAQNFSKIPVKVYSTLNK
jgi:hypothetical protein